MQKSSVYNKRAWRDAGYMYRSHKKDYELGEQDAQTLFVSEYIYCYGLSVLIATGKWSFEFEEACDLLGFQFVSALSLLKSDAPRIKTPTPQPKCKK